MILPSKAKLSAITVLTLLSIINLIPAITYAECEPDLLAAGSTQNGQLGRSVSGAGDINNDGFDDLIVGESGSILGDGRALVFSGSTGEILLTLTAESSGEGFGWAVSGAGDIDNDGHADLIVGAVRNNFNGIFAGRAYLYSGRTGSLLHTFTGEFEGDLFGASVSGSGDVNNDGYSDVIVGAEGSDPDGNNIAGRAYVYSGQTGELIYVFSGTSIGNELGVSVDGAGDVNNDGFADLIVGAHNNAGINAAGMANIYSGKTGAILYTFNGEAYQDHFGFSVSGAGDLDKDGFADVIVGAKWNSSWGQYAGRAYAYSGQTGTLLYTFTGELSGDFFGYSVSGAGDVNFDSYPDVIIGAPHNSIGAPGSGRAYVYSGKDGSLLRTLTGQSSGEMLGWSVSGAGDINDNGYANIIVGAPTGDTGSRDGGNSYVYSLCGICCATRGDSNHDGSFNISDVTFGIAWIFTGGPAPLCNDESDANGDNRFNIADITFGISRIFTGGPAPICGTTGR